MRKESEQGRGARARGRWRGAPHAGGQRFSVRLTLCLTWALPGGSAMAGPGRPVRAGGSVCVCAHARASREGEERERKKKSVRKKNSPSPNPRVAFFLSFSASPRHAPPSHPPHARAPTLAPSQWGWPVDQVAQSAIVVALPLGLHVLADNDSQRGARPPRHKRRGRPQAHTHTLSPPHTHTRTRSVRWTHAHAPPLAHGGAHAWLAWESEGE